MSNTDGTEFTVVGAGLGGALMAIYLGQAGYDVDVYERRPDPRRASAQGGRSINLAISNRGLHALRGAGLADAVISMAVPMRGRMMHSPTGQRSFQQYGTDADQAINSVSRLGLNRLLIEVADRRPNVRLHFSKRLTDLDLSDGTLTIVDEETGEMGNVAGGVIVGADGAFSVVRRPMLRLDRFDFQQSYLRHGYKELTIPPGQDGGFQLEPHALHIWPRGGFMMIALPNQDCSFTCTLFWPFEGENSFEALQTEDDVRRFFRDNFPDAVPLMPSLVTDYFRNPTSTLVTIRCGPWYYRDRVVLLGDASHAVVPFYGQGANAAFEDCPILDECLKRHAPDWAAAGKEYYERRKTNTDTLAELALENFVEMRDRVASRRFLLRKRFEKRLHRLFPMWFTPLYSMITFSLIPYAEARRKAERQDAVIRWVGIVILTVTIIGLLWLWS